MKAQNSCLHVGAPSPSSRCCAEGNRISFALNANGCASVYVNYEIRRFVAGVGSHFSAGKVQEARIIFEQEKLERFFTAY